MQPAAAPTSLNSDSRFAARRTLVVIGLIFSLCLVSLGARADWINLSGAETAPNIAEIYVLEDRVKVVLEVYVADLDTFVALVPDDLMKSADGRPSMQERMQVFANETLQMVTETGEKLPARVDRVERRQRVDRKSPFAGMVNPYTRRRVPEAPADKRVLYVEISYPFTTKPQTLTIVPPHDEQGRGLVGIGFIAYHKSVPVIDFRYLGSSARLTLDWADPWYSKFDNPNLKRHHKDALMSFLYVEPYEVRHEMLLRVKDMATWMDLRLRGEAHIEIDELETLRQRIGEFLLTRNPLRIDGESLAPILDRSNFVKVGLSGIQLLEVPERLEINSAIIGVIITYLTDGLPQEVTVNWDLFTEQIERVPATATDPVGPLKTYLTREDSVHTWTNFLKNYKAPTVRELTVRDSLGELRVPAGAIVAVILLLLIVWLMVRTQRQGRSLKWLSIGAFVIVIGAAASFPYTQFSFARPELAAGDMDEERATILLQALLKNVYRAFDFHREEDVYDKLALSVKGDLLAELYLQNRRSFAIKQAGGAQAKVKAVEIKQVEARRLNDGGPLRYELAGRWLASGSVGHWGHVHTRHNLYDAVVTVEAIDGHWKIAALDLLQEQRISPDAAASATKVNENSSGAR